MLYAFPYGHDSLALRFPAGVTPHELKPSHCPPLADLPAAVRSGLDRPLDAPRLEDMPAPNSIAIAVPDETRPTPVKELLPLVLGRIFACWPDLPRDNVVVIVGGGLHEPATPEALARTVPAEAAMGCRVLAHDARHSPLAELGATSRGTPVKINAAYARAEFRVVIGQIDPHQFVGFTGGAKGVSVGCAGAETIRASHSLLLHEDARAGVLEGNPAREDISEAGRLLGVHLAVNVVLNDAKLPVWVGVGHPDAVLAEGAEVCAAVHGVDLDGLFDVVVASCGGYPKDICLYQAQKGLSTAGQAVRPGGKVLLLAHCGQGVGDDEYSAYVCRFATMGQLMDDFRSAGFRMGAHKAFLFGRTLSRCEAAVHSELPGDVLRRCHLAPGDAQATLDRWLAELPPQGRVAVVPCANSTFFRLKASPPGDGRDPHRFPLQGGTR